MINTGKLKTAAVLAAIAIAAAINVSEACAAAKIAFVRRSGDDSWVFTANADGSCLKRITRGQEPDISPDGSRVACVVSDAGSCSLRLAIFSLTDGKMTAIRGAAGSDVFTPRWSHRGTKLVFNSFSPKGSWRPGVCDITDGSCLTLKPHGSNAEGYVPCWTRSDSAICARDRGNMYFFDPLNGRQMGKRSIAHLFAKNSLYLSSSAGFNASFDGRRWMFCCEDGKSFCPKCASYAASGRRGIICLYSPAAGRLVKIPLKGLCVMDAVWLSGSEVIFSAHRPGERPDPRLTGSDIYKMDLRSRKPVLLLKNGCCVSVSR